MDQSSVNNTVLNDRSVAFRASDGRSLDIGNGDDFENDDDDDKSNSEEGKSNNQTPFLSIA